MNRGPKGASAGPSAPTRSRAFPVAALVVLGAGAGCSSDNMSSVRDATDGGRAMTGDATTAPDPSCSTGETLFFVASELYVPVPGEEPVSGFNVDERVNEVDTDALSCFQPDYDGPGGASGIDNQAAAIAAALSGRFNVNQILFDALADGVFGVGMLISNVDDLDTDDCVTLTITLAYVPGEDGTPEIDDRYRIAAGQTFDYRPVAEVRASIVDGVVRSDVASAQVPLTFLTPPLPLTLRAARTEFLLSEDGLTEGMIGGGVEVDQLLELVHLVQPDYDELGMVLLGNNADLWPNSSGECMGISAGLSFEAVPAVQGEERD